MERGQYASIQAGTFLLLEKLRVLALRRLVKRCQLVHAALEPAKQSQLPLSAPLKPVWMLCAGLWVWLQHLGRARLACQAAHARGDPCGQASLWILWFALGYELGPASMWGEQHAAGMGEVQQA